MNKNQDALCLCLIFSTSADHFQLNGPLSFWLSQLKSGRARRKEIRTESVTREKEKQRSRKTKREKDTSPVTLIQPHATRGWWLFGQRGESRGDGGGDGGESEVLWWWGSVCPLEAKPHPLFTSIHNSTGSTPPCRTDPQGAAPQGGHSIRQKRRQRHPTKPLNTPQIVVEIMQHWKNTWSQWWDASIPLTDKLNPSQGLEVSQRLHRIHFCSCSVYYLTSMMHNMSQM